MDCMDIPDEGEEPCKLLYKHASDEGMGGQDFFASSHRPALLSVPPSNLSIFKLLS